MPYQDFSKTRHQVKPLSLVCKISRLLQQVRLIKEEQLQNS